MPHALTEDYSAEDSQIRHGPAPAGARPVTAPESGAPATATQDSPDVRVTRRKAVSDSSPRSE